jgi:histone-lysine N-methyltransferase SETMAR
MADVEQRYSIKFCVKLGYNPTRTLELLQQAYGDSALSRARVYEWHRRFFEGRDNVEDDERSGRPTTATDIKTTARLADTVRASPHLSVGKLAAEIGISKGSALVILRERLGLRRLCAKWVPHLLNPLQCEERLVKSEALLQRKTDKGPRFLSSIVTGDETWLYFYEPQTKQQSSSWRSPSESRPTKVRQDRFAGKIMALIFFDAQGVVYHRYLHRGQTVTADIYKEVLKSVVDAVRRKRPSFANTGWSLLHDNAPVHTSKKVQAYLMHNNIEVLDHPSYSPDLSPCDFFLFSQLKFPMRGRRFSDEKEIIHASDDVLKQLSQNGFLHAFENLAERWRRCVELRGDYVE